MAGRAEIAEARTGSSVEIRISILADPFISKLLSGESYGWGIFSLIFIFGVHEI